MGNICGNDYTNLAAEEILPDIIITNKNYTKNRQIDISVDCLHHNSDKMKYYKKFRTVCFTSNKRNINSRQGRDYTPLQNACRQYPNSILIEGLINNGANVNSLDYRSENPLMLLCRYNGHRTSLIKLLVESGTNLLQVNNQGNDVLKIMYEKASGNLEGIKYLKQKIRELEERMNSSESIINVSN